MYKGIFILFLIGLLSCSSEGEVVPGHEVRVVVYHHFLKVPFTEVHLKEDAADFPGWRVDDYDFHGTADEDAQLIFKNILPGTHYLLGLGHDGLDSVKGYQSFTVDARDPDKTQKVIFYVTE